MRTGKESYFVLNSLVNVPQKVIITFHCDRRVSAAAQRGAEVSPRPQVGRTADLRRKH